ncbi:MAG: L,D-transpeptidase family protein [Verrucomicrobiales bacterium]|nr:L,D-transpeptidase family protein [Verrucomicrobiales bacterium]
MRASQGKIKTLSPGSLSWNHLLSSKLFLIVFLAFSASGRAQSHWQDKSRQAVVVLTDDWASTTGEMAKFELRANKWREEGRIVPVSVGHKGLGWGVGLHVDRTSHPLKNEGDKRAPAGIFHLEFGFGASPFKERRFPFRQVNSRDRWVDDPNSRFYNQWTVLNDPRFPQDWSSSEVMKREDGIYDYVVVVGHNRQPTIPGRGSAIFMHSWFAPGKSTIGCTAMEKSHIRSLLGWLDLEATPILIQIPMSELQSLKIPPGLRASIELAMQ